MSASAGSGPMPPGRRHDSQHRLDAGAVTWAPDGRNSDIRGVISISSIDFINVSTLGQKK